MSERFYFPEPLKPGRECELEGPEAHHLAHVLRLPAGAQVTLFDGEGTAIDARVLAVSKRAVRLQLGEAVITDPPGLGVVLATAVPKGDRFRWLVEKATEIGVDRLIPLNTERSVVDPRETKLDRMRQNVVAACKQSGRNRLMGIDATIELSRLLQTSGNDGLFLMADPAGGSIATALAERRPGQAVIALVGPEGGWTDQERALARERNVRQVALGRHILRTETAGLVFAAICGAGG